MLCSLLPANRQTFRDTLIKLFQWFWEILWTLFSALAAVGGALVKVLQAVTNALLRGLRRIWAGLERVGRVVLALLERWSADPLDEKSTIGWRWPGNRRKSTSFRVRMTVLKSPGPRRRG
jgi:hypothetical protein